jgi:hypothetical protein
VQLHILSCFFKNKRELSSLSIKKKKETVYQMADVDVDMSDNNNNNNNNREMTVVLDRAQQEYVLLQEAERVHEEHENQSLGWLQKVSDYRNNPVSGFTGPDFDQMDCILRTDCTHEVCREEEERQQEEQRQIQESERLQKKHDHTYEEKEIEQDRIVEEEYLQKEKEIHEAIPWHVRRMEEEEDIDWSSQMSMCSSSSRIEEKKDEKYNDDKLFTEWKTKAAFLTCHKELSDTNLDMCCTPELRTMANANLVVTTSIMPYMIHRSPGQDSSTVAGNVADAVSATLPIELLYDVYKDNATQKIMNYIILVQCTPYERVFGKNGVIKDITYFNTSDVIAMVLVACSRQLVDCLSTGYKKASARHTQEQLDVLFGFHQITNTQTVVARAWIYQHWNLVDPKKQYSKTMPVFNTHFWWGFVSRILQDKLGLSIKYNSQPGTALEAKSKQEEEDEFYAMLIAVDFWATYKIDVASVGLAHRARSQAQHQEGMEFWVDVPLVLNERPYGILTNPHRTCVLCPVSRPETMCVRQNGQWLCSYPDLSVASGGGDAVKYHRDYHNSIDTGYLDMMDS